MKAAGAGTSRPVVIRLIPVLDFGGVESVFVLQSKFIARERFDLRVCTFWKLGDAGRVIEKQGIPVDVLNIDPSIKNPAATHALYKYLRRRQPDVVHASIAEANFHLALVGRLAGVPVTIIEEPGLPNRGLTARLVHAALYRRVDAIVGVSDAACRYVIEREFAPPRKVRRIYNSARPEFFKVQRSRAPSGHEFTILCVGRLVHVKNHARLLAAFRKVLDKHPAARLRLAGDGPLGESLRRLATELEISRQVEFLGFRDDVPRLLLEADAFVLPSLSEGFGLAVAEAMAVGIPVIGAKVGGLPEVMQALGDDWLIEPTDVEAWAGAMLHMIELSPARRQELGDRAREAAQAFAPEANVRQVQALYLELLGRPVDF
jgi:glycosyltransferase involved in cell wall biosynthesis